MNSASISIASHKPSKWPITRMIAQYTMNCYSLKTNTTFSTFLLFTLFFNESPLNPTEERLASIRALQMCYCSFSRNSFNFIFHEVHVSRHRDIRCSRIYLYRKPSRRFGAHSASFFCLLCWYIGPCTVSTLPHLSLWTMHINCTSVENCATTCLTLMQCFISCKHYTWWLP